MMSVVMDLKVPMNASEREAAGQAEAVRLSHEYDGEYGLAAPLHPLAPTGQSAFTDLPDHYSDLLDDVSGVAAERRRREKSAARGRSDYHGKAGSGRRVGTGSRAHAAS